jgi:hypothetical protein
MVEESPDDAFLLLDRIENARQMMQTGQEMMTAAWSRLMLCRRAAIR